MSNVVDYPATIADYLQRTHGDALAVQRLHGLSNARVERVVYAARSLIVKVSPSPRETCVYQEAAALLRGNGIFLPDLEWAARCAGLYWLLLEDIPQPLPRGRWHADPELLAVVCRLHAMTLDSHLPLPDPFIPSWDDSMTAAALSCFPRSVAASLLPTLASLQRESRRLFLPQCSISGDPNPMNWGVRRDGQLVLYDWERCGRGTPALDLAITIPGLGGRVAFEEVASRYITAWRAVGLTAPWSAVPLLARDLALAKVWSVIEFLSQHTKGGGARMAVAARYLVGAFPGWLQRMLEDGL